jgi:HlyD family secretion protein
VAQASSVPVTSGDIEVTVESSGSAQAARSLNLAFQASGQIREVLVKPGARVSAGQPLARLDDQELRLKLQQAEADLKTAQARLVEAREGAATPQDTAQAEAQVRSAEAQLAKTRTGNTTAADIASAEAQLRSARAQLAKTRTGNTTAADIASAEAQLRSAEAQLQRTSVNTSADIAQAEAALRSAEARLQAAQRGPAPDQVSAAQRRLTDAQQTYQKTAAAAASTKATAEQAMHQAADTVRLAQQDYSTAYWDNQQAQSGIDPKTGQRFNEKDQAGNITNPANEELVKQQYAEALRTAEIQLRQAESRLEQAKIAFETAKQQEIADVAQAQAAIDDAQVQLDELMKGPQDTSVAEAQAQVDQARAQLRKLRQGSRADAVQAQAAVDQARAQLQKLRQGGTAADIAQAQAQVDQAEAQLRKQRQGGTAADIAQAQAQVDQSRAALEQLTAPKPESEIAQAEAGVAQAEAGVTAARLALAQATLVAPFSGTVATVNVVPGSYTTTGAATANAAMTIVDTSAMRLEINLSETDVARVKPGQNASITFDALEGQVITGTVESVAPTATEEQNVVTYLVQVAFNPGDVPVKVGMSASATITVERHTNVIQVPTRAIQSQGPAKIINVLYGSAETPVAVRVQTGATNGAFTEIVTCVQTGNQCLRPGDKVQVPMPGPGTKSAAPSGGDFIVPSGGPPGGVFKAIPIGP